MSTYKGFHFIILEDRWNGPDELPTWRFKIQGEASTITKLKYLTSSEDYANSRSALVGVKRTIDYLITAADGLSHHD